MGMRSSLWMVPTVAGVLLLSGCTSDLSSSGGTVTAETAEAFLTGAESGWRAEVDAEGETANRAPDSRCYLVTDAEHKQFRNAMACGPVRRVGTKDGDVWDLSQVVTTASGDGAGLQAPDPDDADESKPRPAEGGLWRPDGKEPADDADTLAAPPAPAADAGYTAVLTQVDVQDLKEVSSPLINPDSAIKVTGVGTAEQISRLGNILRPAGGERFVVARFEQVASDIQVTAGDPKTTYAVDAGGSPHAVDPTDVEDAAAGGGQEPSTVRIRYLVASVPIDSKQVLLTSRHDRTAQSLSLLSGQRTTLQVASAYYRPRTDVKLGQALRKQITVGDFDGRYALTLTQAQLRPWDAEQGWAPTGRAWFRLRYNESTGLPYAGFKMRWSPRFFTATADGAPIMTRSKGNGLDFKENWTEVWSVPANVRQVKVTIHAVMTFTSDAFKPSPGRADFGTLRVDVSFP